MARGTVRPLAALVSSDEERSFLEAQVRRHRVARAMSDRCRMILRCADGLATRRRPQRSACTSTRWARGAGASSRTAWTACWTSPGRDARGAATHWSLRLMAKDKAMQNESNDGYVNSTSACRSRAPPLSQLRPSLYRLRCLSDVSCATFRCTLGVGPMT